MPKIIVLVITSIITVGVCAWALMPRPDAPARVSTSSQAVFLGDSYTVGIGGDGPKWPTTVAAALGWKPVNLALGGTGYVAESGVNGCGKEHCGNYLEQAAKITGTPEVIIIAGGRNDTADKIGAGALALFTKLKAKHPKSKIIALSPWTDAAPPAAPFTAKVNAVKKAADDAGITYVDTGQPFVGHPNTAGYLALSTLLTTKLAEATGRPAPEDTPTPVSASEARQELIRDALRQKTWPELTPAISALGEGARVPEWIEDECLNVDDSNVDDCAYGDTESAQQVALLGDAHAIGYLPALREAFAKQRVQSLTMQNCPAAAVTVRIRTPQRLAPYPECADHRAWVADWVSEHKPQTIVIVDAWDTPNRMPGDDTAAKLREYKAALTAEVQQFAETGATVVVLASPPPGRVLQDCKDPADCVRTPPSAYSDWATVSADAVTQAGAPTALFVRTDSWFCATGSCPSFVGGIALFADGTNLTAPAAKAVAPLLAQAIAAHQTEMNQES